jgi:catechol 2,3-dioxygenase-like lactoylglutathione lyase family enzyme
MIKPHTLAHVVYQTRRFDTMIGWYQTVFGADIVHRDPALAFLTFDAEHHRFAFANLDVMKPEAADAGQRGDIGVNHVAWSFTSAHDLLATYKRLKAEGILPYWPVHHGITLSLYYADPDGNRMEFQVEALTVAEANAYMAGPLMAANPVGVAWDPDALLARAEAGASEAELLAQPAGAMSPIPAAHGF